MAAVAGQGRRRCLSCRWQSCIMSGPLAPIPERMDTILDQEHDRDAFPRLHRGRSRRSCSSGASAGSGCAAPGRCAPGSPGWSGPGIHAALRAGAQRTLATPESWSSPRSTRAAIEAMPEGCIAVVDAMGVRDAGIFGDILCARMPQARGCRAGHRRRRARCRGCSRHRPAGLVRPAWPRRPRWPVLTFVGWQEPIGLRRGCGVPPTTWWSSTRTGAVVIPRALLEATVSEAVRTGAAGSVDHAGGAGGSCVAGPVSARWQRPGRATPPPRAGAGPARSGRHAAMRKLRHPDRLGLHLRVVLPGHVVIGPGRAELLEAIRAHGSISAAGRAPWA